MEHPLRLKVPAEVQPYFRAWLAQDPDALAAAFALEGELLGPRLDAPVAGREAIRAFFAAFLRSNEGLELHRSRFFTAPGQVISVSELTMELPILGPGRYLLSAAQLIEFDEGGLIRRMRHFVDTEVAVRMAGT